MVSTQLIITMTEEEEGGYIIEKFSRSIDGMWANVLDEHSDDEDNTWGFMDRSTTPPPSSVLDIQLDKSLSYVNEETVHSLGCMFDGMMLAMMPDDDDELVETRSNQLFSSKGIRDPGLPPRPTRSRSRVEEREEDRESGFFSFMFRSSENEAQEDETRQVSDDASLDGPDVMAPAPLVKRISFKRVSSSFRRREKEKERTDLEEEDDIENRVSGSSNDKTKSKKGREKKQEEEDDDDGDFFGESKEEKETTSLLSFMFGTEETKGSSNDMPKQKSIKREKKQEQEDDDRSLFSFLVGTEGTRGSTCDKSKSKRTIQGQEEDDDQGYFSFLLFGDTNDVIDDDTACSSRRSRSKRNNLGKPPLPRASLAKKFSRHGTSRSSGESVASDGPSAQVRLVRRNSFRRERSGSRPEGLWSLQTDRF